MNLEEKTNCTFCKRVIYFFMTEEKPLPKLTLILGSNEWFSLTQKMVIAKHQLHSG